jgi:hypothetical protein
MIVNRSDHACNKSFCYNCTSLSRREWPITWDHDLRMSCDEILDVTMTVTRVYQNINLLIPKHGLKLDQCAKYGFTSSNTTQTTFAFDACFVWKLAPPADERSGFFIENLSRRLARSSTY